MGGPDSACEALYKPHDHTYIYGNNSPVLQTSELKKEKLAV
jgi:hypothetical protein